MAEKKLPVINPRLVIRDDLDGWGIVFDPDENLAYALNPLSALIMKHLDGKHTEEDILKIIRQSCENVPQDIDTHLREFIARLSENKLVGYQN